MKFSVLTVSAFFAVQSANAFHLQGAPFTQTHATELYSTPPGSNPGGTPFYAAKGPPTPGGPPQQFSSPSQQSRSFNPASNELFDWVDVPAKRIQGGGTIVTYQMPAHADRCQMYFETDGRPLKAKINVWVGPIRQIHNLEIDSHDGSKTPFQSTIKFKKIQPVVKISTPSTLEFPLIAKVRVPTVQRSAELETMTLKTFDEGPRERVQGGPVSGKGGGAIRTFPIPSNVESVQVIIWSKNTGKKSCKAKIEVFQGPNNNKQVYDLQVSGGLQPYHCVLQTPGGEGATLRIQNKKFVEDGLFEVVVVPYKVGPEPDSDAVVSTDNWWG